MTGASDTPTAVQEEESQVSGSDEDIEEREEDAPEVREALP